MTAAHPTEWPNSKPAPKLPRMLIIRSIILYDILIIIRNIVCDIATVVIVIATTMTIISTIRL